MKVQYTELSPERDWWRNAGFDDVAAGLSNGVPIVAAASEGEFDVFDVSAPRRPTRVYHGAVGGNGQLHIVDGRVLATGSLGIAFHTIARGSDPIVVCRRAVADSGVSGDALYVLRDDHLLEIRSAHGGLPRGEASVTRAVSVAAGKGFVAVAVRAGLRVLIPRGERQVVHGPTLRLDGLRRLYGNLPRHDSRMICAEDASGGWTLIDLSNPHAARVVARYSRRPWFVNAAVVGRSLARIRSGGHALRLSSVGRSTEATLA